jgi:hypothetical protein
MPDKRSNFLVIVVDDLGFSKAGALEASEIRTPQH